MANYRSRGEDKFCSTFAAPEGIAPDLSVVIGDFGVGSDSPILLDYRDDRSSASVICLKWSGPLGLPNVWLRCAGTFDECADMLALDCSDNSPST